MEKHEARLDELKDDEGGEDLMAKTQERIEALEKHDPEGMAAKFTAWEETMPAGLEKIEQMSVDIEKQNLQVAELAKRLSDVEKVGSDAADIVRKIKTDWDNAIDLIKQSAAKDTKTQKRMDEVEEKTNCQTK